MYGHNHPEFLALQVALLQSIAVVIGVFLSIMAVTLTAYWLLLVKKPKPTQPTDEDVDAWVNDLRIHIVVGNCITEQELAERDALEAQTKEEDESWLL